MGQYERDGLEAIGLKLIGVCDETIENIGHNWNELPAKKVVVEDGFEPSKA